jgi:hypothetical protein
VTKPQPGPSSGVTENALEVEDLFTDGTGGPSGLARPRTSELTEPETRAQLVRSASGAYKTRQYKPPPPLR